MICPGCNKQVKDDAKFCVFCGNSFAPKAAPINEPENLGDTQVFVRPAKAPAGAPPIPVQPAPQPTPHQPENKNSKKKIIIAVAAIIVALAVAGSAVFFLFFNKSSADEDSSDASSGVDAASVEKAFGERIIAVAEEYGVASVKEMAKDVSYSTDTYWADRNGLMSAVQKDLDNDGDDELLIVRVDSQSDTRYLIFEVYEYADGKSVLSDSASVETTGNDTSISETNAYLYNIDGTEHICVESNAKGVMVNYISPEYNVYGYNGKKLTRELNIARTYVGSDGNELTRTTPKGEDVIYRKAPAEEASGAYKDSESPAAAAMEDFGFNRSSDTLVSEPYPSYFDDASVKLCSFNTEQESEMSGGVVKLKSTAKDYTGVKAKVNGTDTTQDETRATEKATETAAETEAATSAENRNEATSAQTASNTSKGTVSNPSPTTTEDDNQDNDSDNDDGEVIDDGNNDDEDNEGGDETSDEGDGDSDDGDDDEIVLPLDYDNDED